MLRHDRRALVAGGAGFLGSHLCELLLAQGMTVVCIDNLQGGCRANLATLLGHPGFLFVEGDVVDPLPRMVTSGDYHEIYHLADGAAAGTTDPEHVLLTGVIGTRQLLAVAERTGARFLMGSTGGSEGEGWAGGAAPDTADPHACAVAGRRAAEALAFGYRRTGRATVRVARIFDTYGPRQRHDGGVVAGLIAGVPGDRPPAAIADACLCYVADIVAGLVALMRCTGQPGPVDLGHPDAVAVTELARRVARLTGRHVAFARQPTTDGPPAPRPDVAATRALLGWWPATSLDAGLAATVACATQPGSLLQAAQPMPLPVLRSASA